MSKAFDFDPMDYVSYDYKQLTREEVKEILNDTPIGTFLMRDSLKDLDQKVLCVKEAPNTINSYKIIHHINEKGIKRYHIFGKDDMVFKSIAEILEFYSAHYLNQSPLIKPDPVDDLYFRKGEVLTVLDFTIYDKWWKAKNSKNQIGIIPVDYVKRMDITAWKAYDEEKSENSVEVSHQQSDTDACTSTRTSENVYGCFVECPFNARVVQDYTPSPYENSHVSLKKGQIVRVIEMKEMGKWYGEVNNLKGLFPFNRVEIINE